MAHEIDRAFFAREGAWHRLGTVVANELTAADAILAAKLGWTVGKSPLFVRGGGDGAFTEVPDYFGIRRDDTGDVLGISGKVYQPYQNADAFKFMDEAIGANLMSFHTAGSLKGGQIVWILCKLPRSLGTDVDKTEKYLLFRSGHKPGYGIHVDLTPIRVVCWNTLSQAVTMIEYGKNGGKDGKQRRKGFSAWHNGKVLDRMTDAKRLVAEAEGRLAEFDEVSQRLMQVSFSDEDFIRMSMNLLRPGDEALESGKVADITTRRMNQWNQLIDHFLYGKGAELPTSNHTAWGAINAVTEWVDYSRSTAGGDDMARLDNRVVSVLYGSGRAVKENAAGTIMQYAGTGDEIELSDSIRRLRDQIDFGVVKRS